MLKNDSKRRFRNRAWGTANQHNALQPPCVPRRNICENQTFVTFSTLEPTVGSCGAHHSCNPFCAFYNLTYCGWVPAEPTQNLRILLHAQRWNPPWVPEDTILAIPSALSTILRIVALHENKWFLHILELEPTVRPCGTYTKTEDFITFSTLEPAVGFCGAHHSCNPFCAF